MNRSITIPIPRWATARFLAAVAAVAAVALVAACGASPSAGQKAENGQQQNIENTYLQNQPVHANPTSQIRQTLQDIQDAQEKTTATTTFVFEKGAPDPIMVCPSIGTPVPVTTSLTNPEQVNSWGGGSGVYTVPQMDPNGVYTPTDADGTYVMCVNAQGQQEATYAEGDVESVFGPATWDPKSKTIVLTGPASFAFKATK